MPKRFILLFVLGLVLALSFIPSITGFAQSGDNPTACEFQPMAVSRTPTVENIRQLGATGSNISWDNTYVGLHRWNTKQWPAVDYLVETTVAFKNGGIVSWVGTDGAGGGYSIIIDGFDECSGWRSFYGHLDYNPVSKFSVGQKVGPNDVIGVPGCSGFESNCETKGDQIAKHNHVTLGYWSDSFAFDDGTQIANVKGYWWIHPARVEGTVSVAPAQPEITPSPQEITGEGFSATLDVPPADLKYTDTVGKLIAFANHYRFFIYVVVGFLFIVLLGSIDYSSGFGSALNVALVAILIVLAVTFFVGVDQVKAYIDVKLIPSDSLDATPESGKGYSATLEKTPEEQPTDPYEYSGSTLDSLDAEQNQTLDAIISIGLSRNVPERYILAAIATGLVEDNLHNSTNVRDHDSQNWRQERSMFYAVKWAQTGGALNLDGSVNRFYDECAELDVNQPAGKLAADVQRPAVQYRGRYHERMSQAENLLSEWKIKNGQ